MADHAEDEIHKEMFGCYPWEDASVCVGEPTVIMSNVNDSRNYLEAVGIKNKKRVYRSFETEVLKKPCGKTRKSFKMIKVCTTHFDLFKRFVDCNLEIFVNDKKLKNLHIPETMGLNNDK